MLEWVAIGAAFGFLFILAKILVDTANRVKAIKNQLGRLSLTFLKIENDIEAVHNSLIVLAADDAQKKSALTKLLDRRKEQFRTIVENGTDARQIMRGLEEPDIDEDPNYWSQRRRDLFGFDEKDTPQ